MDTLQIKKKIGGIWEHYPSGQPMFILSDWYVKSGVPYFQIEEIGGSQRKIYDVANVTVFDIGGAPESFSNITDLMTRLKALGYTPFAVESGGGSFSDITGNATDNASLVDEFVSRYGTKPGKPIEGDLEVEEGTRIYFDNGFYSAYLSFEDGGIYMQGINSIGENYGFAINQGGEFRFDSDVPTSVGIKSAKDFTQNYPTDGTEDLIFPQIKYVKDNFIRILNNVNSSITAPLNSRLNVIATCTISDPTPVGGKGYYEVFVDKGTCTIGGIAYPAGSLVFRNYDGGWKTTVFQKKLPIKISTGVSGTYNIDPNINDTYAITITGNTKLDFINFSTVFGQTVSFDVVGNFGMTYSAGAKVSGAYMGGASLNKGVAEVVNGILTISWTNYV